MKDILKEAEYILKNKYLGDMIIILTTWLIKNYIRVIIKSNISSR
jgi:hypothetical protein